MTVETRAAPPPRTLWGETWRVLLAALLAVPLVSGQAFGTQSPVFDIPWQVEAASIPVSAVLLSLRRRWPLPVAATLGLLTAALTAPVPFAGIAFISLATHRRWGWNIGVAVLWLLASVSYLTLQPHAAPSTISAVVFYITCVFMTGFCIAAGHAIGTRRELLANLQAQVAAAQAEQAARVDQARSAERSRIAREMHDVLAHRISIVAMHSGALAYRTDLPAEKVQETAEIIRDNSTQALAELREVLGVLRREDADTVVEPPQPTLARMNDLLRSAPAEDGPIEVDTQGRLDDLPESVSRTAYRVVQECVTNRRKHAPGRPLHLTLTRSADEILVRAENETLPGHLHEASSGLGLLGLTERVSLAGGRLRYGRDRSDRFVVEAHLPLQEETA